MGRPAANDQMKQELKDHITQSFTKLEGMLQAHVLLHEEDRQRMAALQAEVVKVSSLISALTRKCAFICCSTADMNL
jgi:hypothetical protein